VHNLSGDAAVALHPAEHQRQGRWKAVTLNPQTKRSTSQTQLVKQDFRQTGKPRLAQDTAMIIDHCTPESTEWSALEKPVAPLPNPPPAGNTFPGAGEGI
jgi:hypothetical protein